MKMRQMLVYGAGDKFKEERDVVLLGKDFP